MKPHTFCSREVGSSFTWSTYTDTFSIEQFHEQEIGNVSMGTNWRLIQDLSVLHNVSGYQITPVDMGLGGKVIECYRTGGRTAQRVDAIDYAVDISEFGWSKEKCVQNFKVELKGVGSHESQARSHEWDFLCDFISINRINFGGRPFGGQNEMYARTVFGFTLSDLGKTSIKFAPTFEWYHLSDALHTLIDTEAEMIGKVFQPDEDYFYRGKVTQLKRLVPSNIRGIHLDVANERDLVYLVKQLGATKDDRDKTYDILLEDLNRYIENFFTIRPAPKGSMTLDGDVAEFEWDKIGDIHVSHLHKKSGAFVYAKDMVLAPTGAYWVDLESYRVNELYDSLGLICDVRDGMHLLFKDFFRMCTQYQIGSVIAEQGSITAATCKEVEQSTFSDVMRAFNQFDAFDFGVHEGILHQSFIGPFQLFYKTPLEFYEARYGGLD